MGYGSDVGEVSTEGLKTGCWQDNPVDVAGKDLT